MSPLVFALDSERHVLFVAFGVYDNAGFDYYASDAVLQTPPT